MKRDVLSGLTNWLLRKCLSKWSDSRWRCVSGFKVISPTNMWPHYIKSGRISPLWGIKISSRSMLEIGCLKLYKLRFGLNSSIYCKIKWLRRHNLALVVMSTG
jgi:hypothetical protein